MGLPAHWIGAVSPIVPMPAAALPHVPPAHPRSSSWVGWAAVAAVVGGTSLEIGGLWDISWHMTIGRDAFWTPAHFAIYLGGALGGIACGALAIWTTFWGDAASRAASVRLWGGRAPFGAWIVIWGAVAMLTAGPFDNWWHNAYGLDVRILSPPHVVLFLGGGAVRLGACLLILGVQNRGEGRDSRIATWFFPYVGAGLLASSAVVLTSQLWPERQHSSAYLLCAALAFPPLLLAIARASKLPWAATMAAVCYMLFVGAMIWILPLFAAQPRLGPITHPVTHMVAPPFPQLLILPAIAIDLFKQRAGFGRSWQRDGVLAAAAGAVFLAIFLPAQWYFSKFYLSPAAANAFFGVDRIWSYNTPNYLIRFSFWDDENAAAAGSLLRAWIAAAATGFCGLRLGNWMAKVKR
jgi:hypothetical protein